MNTKSNTELKAFFEANDFSVHLFTQDNQECAEVEKWTKGGVDMIMCLQPFNVKSFVDAVDSFNVDEEIDLHRQGESYKQNFTLSQSLEDFTNFHNHLKEVAAELTK